MKKIFYIAEIGINHNGDVSITKELIKKAKDSGFNSVKFQKRTIDKVYSKELLDQPRESPWGKTQRDQKMGLEFSYDEYLEIDKYCKSLNIDWFASAWDVESIIFLDQFDLKYHKIASPMIVDVNFLEEVAKRRLYTFISTGMSSVENIDKAVGKVTIADADVVVSGGRGLKGPENWHLIEDLAETLGAATACSKPVSDMGWRPHSEHVGQTGKPVASNLYIAIGVSGAIQHLAGINSSKVKVVVNIDPEAPFFKAADYGIVGDAFEVVPQLIKKLRAFKNLN